MATRGRRCAASRRAIRATTPPPARCSTSKRASALAACAATAGSSAGARVGRAPVAHRVCGLPVARHAARRDHRRPGARGVRARPRVLRGAPRPDESRVHAMPRPELGQAAARPKRSARVTATRFPRIASNGRAGLAAAAHPRVPVRHSREMPPPGAPELTDVELYLAWRAQGLPLEAPGVRR